MGVRGVRTTEGPGPLTCAVTAHSRLGSQLRVTHAPGRAHSSLSKGRITKQGTRLGRSLPPVHTVAIRETHRTRALKLGGLNNEGSEASSEGLAPEEAALELYTLARRVAEEQKRGRDRESTVSAVDMNFQGEKKRAKALASMLGLGARPLSAATEPLVAASGSDDGDDGDALSQLGGETRAMALWALLVLGGPLYFADEVEQLLQATKDPGFHVVCAEILSRSSQFADLSKDPKSCGQLAQVALELRFCNSESYNQQLEEGFRIVVSQFQRMELSQQSFRRASRDSIHQREIARVLQTLGLDVHKEYQDPITGYMVDVAVFPNQDSRAALEVDGPHHYTRNTGALLGNAQMKQRHLQSAGWRVARVSYRSWEAVQGSAAQRGYLRGLLDLAGQ